MSATSTIDSIHFSGEPILDLLVGAGVLERAEAARLRSSPSGWTIEQRLVSESAVPHTEVVRALIDLTGVHAIPVDGEWVDAGIANMVTRAAAKKHGFLPLVAERKRLFVLGPRHSPDLLPRPRAADGMTIVTLGTVDDFGVRLRRLYQALEPLASHERLFGEDLVARKLVSTQQLAEALAAQRAAGGHLGELLIRGHAIDDSTLYDALAGFEGVPFFSTARLLELTDPGTACRLPRAFCVCYRALALRTEEDKVWVATADLHNETVLSEIAATLSCRAAHAGIASPRSIAAVLETVFEAGAPLSRLPPPEVPFNPAAASEIPAQLGAILAEAVERHASDVHVERFEDRVQVRLRVDGELLPLEGSGFPMQALASVVAKVKVDAQLDIAEHRRPQDGVMRRNLAGRRIDFRVAIQPTIWGENVVLRVLDQERSFPTLESLGYRPELLVTLRRLLLNPQGLVLLTGPTGCGKTTTLYTILEELRRTHLKIVTAEDPVEHAIEGIQQSQVNESIGNSFEHFLRAFLRQDPDVILVGEIRDPETAEMAVRAALTGHLVLSTLHVNDAIGTVRRLIDLGIEPNLVTQTLLLVISQRLVRKICSKCAEPSVPDAGLVAEFYPRGLPPGAMFRHGRGCPACHHTGYQGRVALVESWVPDDAVRQKIDAGYAFAELRRQVEAQGMRPLVLEGLDLAASGVTDLAELQAAVPWEQIMRAVHRAPAGS